MSQVRRRQPLPEVAPSPSMEELPNIRGDEVNIAVLLLLYLLQGIPLGLSGALPMILQNRGASFKQQAAFSFALWPFSIKLLWAPIVDCLSYKNFGLRKTWLVPTQLLIGLSLIIMSYNLEDWLGISDTKKEPSILLITVLFFSLNFLVATQDIAVDGWAITMLHRRNVNYASTCNSAGQMAGYFLGYVIFIALESAEFCNKYIRSEPKTEGIVSLTGFFYFWGVVYIIVTLAIAFFKKESGEEMPPTSPFRAIVDSYKQLFQILKLPSILRLTIFSLTAKIGFAACDGVTTLKLTESGVPKEKLAILAVPLVPLQVILPIIVTGISSRSRHLELYLKVYPFRLGFNIITALIVSMTHLILVDNEIPGYFYVILLIVLCFQQVTVTTMFVQAMAFYAHIADPSVGGTYMTLLNTVNNLGGTWTTTTALALIDTFTFKSCTNETLGSDCSTSTLTKDCEDSGGACNTLVDGYYLETIILTIFGFIWFKYWGQKVVRHLQLRPLESWKVRGR